MLLQSHTTELQDFELPIVADHKQRHPRLERLICAALCDDKLAATLVHSPALALQRYDVARRLSSSEQRLVQSITGARDIFDYAGQLHARVNQANWVGRRAQIVPAFERPVAEAALEAPSHT